MRPRAAQTATVAEIRDDFRYAAVSVSVQRQSRYPKRDEFELPLASSSLGEPFSTLDLFLARVLHCTADIVQLKEPK